MKFDIVSDLHVEFNKRWDELPEYDGVSSIYPWHLEKQSDILIIAGDCSNDPFRTLGVIEEAQRFYDRVVFTDGNHEHYTGRKHKKKKNRGNVTDHCNLFRLYDMDNPKVTYLDGTNWVDTGDGIIIGANGWYDWTAHAWTTREQQHQAWKDDSNDSRMIEFAPNGYPDKLARHHAELLRQRVLEAQGETGLNEIVIVTHTIPNRVGLISDGTRWGHLNGSYMNSIMESVWMADETDLIKAWCFGHTHNHCDSVVNGIRFVNNARGYYAYATHSETKYTGLKMVDTTETYRSAFEID